MLCCLSVVVTLLLIYFYPLALIALAGAVGALVYRLRGMPTSANGARTGANDAPTHANEQLAGTSALANAQLAASTYPLRRKWKTPADLERAFDLVCKFRLSFVPAKYAIANMPEVGQLYYNGRAQVIACTLADYDSMNWISDWFNEPARLACKRYDEPCSPLDYWTRTRARADTSLQTSDTQLVTLARTHPRAASDAIYAKIRGCNNFRPGLMRGWIAYMVADCAVAERAVAQSAATTKPFKILDFSAGWGDRLIGAIAACADGTRTQYWGVDPNPSVHGGYKEIIDTLCPRANANRADYTMIQSAFERAELPPDCAELDLVFTSPPYFDLEVYSALGASAVAGARSADGAAADQSIQQYPRLDDWFDGFLMFSLRRAWGLMRAGGASSGTLSANSALGGVCALADAGQLVVIINNIRDKPDYVLRMVKAVSALPGACYMGAVAYADVIGKRAFARADNTTQVLTSADLKSPQPMWVWRKLSPGAVAIVPLMPWHARGLTAVASDPRVMGTVGQGRTWNRARVDTLIQHALADSDKPARKRKYWHWVIISGGATAPANDATAPANDATAPDGADGADGAPVIGYIGLHPLGETASAHTRAINLQVRVFIARDKWGKGVASAAVAHMIEALQREFAPSDMVTIFMLMREDNTASEKLAIKHNFASMPATSMGAVTLKQYSRPLFT